MIEDYIKERKRKLRNFENLGINPYPAEISRTHFIKEVIDYFSSFEKKKQRVSLAGRITGARGQGGVMFLDVEDVSGQIQIVLKKNNLKYFKTFANNLDIGDFVSATGQVFRTKKGEKSIEAKKLEIIVKTLRPLPSKHYGLEDMETRLRRRYLDLLANREARNLFVKKSIFWRTVRDFLTAEDFLEVQTPVLEDIPGGAEAEPFKTHHNALNKDFYLRISLELALKRLLVGGYERVFEIGRVFRNEGIDREHLQEYDSMEFYQAYGNHKEGMRLVERLFKKVVRNTTGGYLTDFEKIKIKWNSKWRKIDYFSAFKKETGIDLNKTNLEELRKKARQLKIEFKNNYGKGRMIDVIYKKTVRQKLIQPAFLVGHPVEISPLSKRDPFNPKKALRFQIVAAKSELGNGFSEINDPVDQRERFKIQAELRKKGDKEAHMTDKDFIEALEYGMPPAVGFGMSERFFAVLMNLPIRETVIFPQMKTKIGK